MQAILETFATGGPWVEYWGLPIRVYTDEAGALTTITTGTHEPTTTTREPITFPLEMMAFTTAFQGEMPRVEETGSASVGNKNDKANDEGDEGDEKDSVGSIVEVSRMGLVGIMALAGLM